MRVQSLGVLTLLAVSIPVRAADPVQATQAGNVLTLDNGLVRVRYDGTLSASAGKTEFLRSARLSQAGGKAAVADVRNDLGTGKAIAITYADGSADRVALYPGSPLVFFQSHLHNPGKDVKVIDKTLPVSLHIQLPPKANLLGCDGLTPADRPRASYSFLAAADPSGRAGVVAGWVTHHRGSGIVTSKPDADGLRVDGRSEYGKLRIPPGRSVEGETFAVGYFANALDGLEKYADAIAVAHKIRLRPIPSGYCTWYSNPHGNAADEKHLAELARFSKEHLAPFGFNVVQIDDGWQLARRDFTDYRHGDKARYPTGMKATADTIRGLGETAGLWLIPFGWDPTRPVFQEHQDWFVKRPDGKTPFEVKWAGTCFDMTHPGARDFLRQVVSRITREWGYRYLKIDGLWTGMAVEILYPQPTVRDDKLGDAVFHDPNKTNVEAYRDGLKLVREAAGDDTYIVGCNIAQNMRTLGGSFGLVDAMRVGRDIKASWDKILPCMEMGSRLYFFHGRVWHNDPDCLMLREPLTLDQARAWGSWIALSGQLNIVSEWLPGLPADRLDVIKRTMPNAGLCGRPVDLFERDWPRLWTQRHGNRTVVGLFNWDTGAPHTLSVPPEAIGLPADSSGEFVGFDYWENKFVGPTRGAPTLIVRPGSCNVLSVRPAARQPLVVSTSRHVTQGILDLKEEKWDAGQRTLSGRSEVVGGDPYELRIVSPDGAWTVAAAEVSADDRAAGAKIDFKADGPHARVTIQAPANRTVRWTVKY